MAKKAMVQSYETDRIDSARLLFTLRSAGGMQVSRKST